MWRPFDNGTTIGRRGSEDGVILRDEEHDSGARITLERDCSHGVPFAITCGIDGWFFHDRRLGTKPEAEFATMQAELDAILEMIPQTGDPAAESKMAAVSDAISDFVSRFP